jgi:hypothetical protein
LDLAKVSAWEWRRELASDSGSSRESALDLELRQASASGWDLNRASVSDSD